MNQQKGKATGERNAPRRDSIPQCSAPRELASRFFKVVSVIVNKTNVTVIKGFFDL
jgi:hypothetical protein